MNLRAALARVTSSGRYIAEIDGLRFVAIAAVVIFHLAWMVLPPDVDRRAVLANDPVGWVLLQGFIGVQLFFVISGFVLALPFAEARLRGAVPVGLRAYYLRRLTRLEPPYVLSLLLLFALRVAQDPSAAAALLPHLAASLAYVHTAVYDAPSTVNSVAWSLEVEVQFYLLMPLFAALFSVRAPRLRRALLVALIVAACAAQAAAGEVSYRLSHSLLFQIQYFLAGFLLADWYLLAPRAAARSWRWDLITAAAFVAIVPLMQAGALGHVLLPFAMCLAYVGAFRGRAANRLLTRPWLTAVGGMCYTIYLYHLNILGNALKLTNPLTAGAPLWLQVPAQALLTLPALLLLSTLLFVAVEKPCMRRDWPTALLAWLRRRRGAALRFPLSHGGEPREGAR
ncbi:MAG: acyltransferase [Deltaproteobacteria bacterium]|nr:acyltransferase [Deltaproteobacteria bacterium]